MKYYIKICDLYCYKDNQRYHYGNFETYEEAVIESKKMIDDFLENNWKPEITLQELVLLFGFIGQSLVILPEVDNENTFSATNYATIKAEIIFRKHEDLSQDL